MKIPRCRNFSSLLSVARAPLRVEPTTTISAFKDSILRCAVGSIGLPPIAGFLRALPAPPSTKSGSKRRSRRKPPLTPGRSLKQPRGAPSAAAVPHGIRLRPTVEGLPRILGTSHGICARALLSLARSSYDITLRYGVRPSCRIQCMLGIFIVFDRIHHFVPIFPICCKLCELFQL